MKRSSHLRHLPVLAGPAALLLTAAVAIAAPGASDHKPADGAAAHSSVPSPSPYAGEERREIKALAPDQVAGLRAGRGMGYGRTAELNRYPGPMHVLELAAALKLTEDQLKSTRGIHARMKERARAAGARLVEAEAEMDRLFREGTITEATLKSSLEKIGALQAEVRGAHLLAHVEQRAVLTTEQVERYGELRGYGKRPPGHRGPALNPDSVRKEGGRSPGKEERERKGRTGRTNRNAP